MSIRYAASLYALLALHAGRDEPTAHAQPKVGDGAAQPGAALDRHGDPLPPGAVARIGTIRLRHGGPVTSVAVSPDGKRFASTDGHTVGVWDAATGRSLAFRYLPWQYGIWSPVVSPDGSLIACRLADGALGVQETTSGRQCCALPCKSDGIYALAFSPNNRWLVSADTGGRNTVLWDLRGARAAWRWQSPLADANIALAHAFSPDSTLLATVGSGKIVLLDVMAGKEVRRLGWEKKLDSLFGVAFSPDGRLLATHDGWSQIHLWEVKTERLLHDIAARRPNAGPVFSLDGKHVGCGNEAGESCFWDVETAKLTLRLAGRTEGRSVTLAFAPGGKTLVSGGEDHALHLWDFSSGKERFPPANPAGEVLANFLADGKTLLVQSVYRSQAFDGTIDPRLGFWDLKGNSLKQTTFAPLLVDGRAVTYAWPLAPDGSTLALADGFPFGRYHRVWRNRELCTTLRICNAKSGKELQRWANLPCELHEVRFSPDGRFLFAHMDSAGLNGDDYHRLPILQVWKRTSLGSFKPVARLPADASTFCCAPDSRWVSVTSSGGCAIYECETGKLRSRIADLPGVVRAISPSGRVLVCASDERRTAHLVELATGKPICKLEGSPRYLVRPCFAVSPDGRIVAGDLNSAVIFLWDAFTGKQLGKLHGHRGHVRSLCFSPDGRYLVSGSYDTTSLIWDYRKALPASTTGPIRHTPEHLRRLWDKLRTADTERESRLAAQAR